MAGRTKVPATVAAVISCLLVLASCSADSNPSEAAPIRSSTPSPTHNEPTALETFAELRERADRIFSERDFTGMSEVYDPSGPIWARVLADLKAMRKAGVRFRSLDRILKTRVIRQTDSRIVVRETLISDGRFVYANGKEAISKRDPQRQIVRWTLSRTGEDFRIFDSVIESSKDATG